MNKTAFVIEFDNGQDYEEHRNWPVYICLDETNGKRKVKEWNECIKIINDQAPESPTNSSEDDFLEKIDAYNHYFKKIKFPIGMDSQSDLEGSYRLIELPLI